MLQRFFSDYGMLVVLLVLCIGFSVATWDEQHPNGPSAAREVAERISAEHPAGVRVVIAARPVPVDDVLFADELRRLLTERRIPMVATLRGDPVQGNAALKKLEKDGKTFDVLATNHYTRSSWRFLDKIPRYYPKLGRPKILTPTSYPWPNFLKLSNLLNVANQIAIIAIIAIGMTMVIITGGIDLSVGSLIALSAIVATWFIWTAGRQLPFEPVFPMATLVWIVMLVLIGGIALVWSRKQRAGFGRAAALCSLGGAGIFLLYALVPFAVAPFVQLLQTVGPTPAVMVVCGLIAVLLCAGIGLFSGSMVTFFRVPSFIVTLAMMLVARGLAEKISGNESIIQIPKSFNTLGRGTLLGIPIAVLLMLTLYLLAHFLMTRMALGRYIYAVGGNVKAAQLSGVPVRRVLLFVYTISGALAGLGGVIMASRLESGDPTIGKMYELYVIAAAVVGGTSLSGGEGKIFGTLIGAFIIAVIQNGMNLTGMGGPDQQIVLGVVILAAVLFDMVKRNTDVA